MFPSLVNFRILDSVRNLRACLGTKFISLWLQYLLFVWKTFRGILHNHFITFFMFIASFECGVDYGTSFKLSWTSFSGLVLYWFRYSVVRLPCKAESIRKPSMILFGSFCVKDFYTNLKQMLPFII